jgi:thiol:disulfide interchange protein DsbD
MNLQPDNIGYIGAFLGGILVSFSPCTYPLIPITLSFIDIKAGSHPLKGLFYSLIYVLGMAVTYSILGLIAAFTGKLFGQIAQHPVSYLIVGNACILAGLSFLEVFQINFPGIALHHKIKKPSGYFPVFLLGLASGLIVGPCMTPALSAILIIVAKKQNLFYGASLLFVFAYGVGFLLILLGTFGSLFLNLPKSGAWLVRIKKASGFILIALGEYFIIQGGRLM